MMYSSRLPLAARAGAALWASFVWAAGAAQEVPAHMKFALVDGELRALARPELRLNAKGGNISVGVPLILWPCSAHNHELFDPVSPEGLIRLTVVPREPGGSGGLCLNAEGGARSGANIVTWPCAQTGELVQHEQFVYDEVTGLLRYKHDRELCMNVKGGATALGAELILWPCGEEPGPNEQFYFEDGMIVLRLNRTLHLNVEGGNLQDPGKKVLIWNCHAGAHESFAFGRDGRLRLSGQEALCVNAEGGLGPGQRLVLFPCQEAPAENELFHQDDELGVILATAQTNLAFNAAGGGLRPGDEVMLWPLNEKLEL
mmetsp:Transcript_89626/g.256795  ORF Transcript_89626/g.256795 Transcript_89626/m.256795 type:complete len:315 (-) Transcript_89626:56-1000(-)